MDENQIITLLWPKTQNEINMISELRSDDQYAHNATPTSSVPPHPTSHSGSIDFSLRVLYFLSLFHHVVNFPVPLAAVNNWPKESSLSPVHCS